MSRNECQQLFQSSNARINNDPKVLTLKKEESKKSKGKSNF
uniref:Uncharacterized protein n=1 Tax=Lepeophtheirus salmonis TaxID=72036 RepID=A0A0K2T216_LEPSM